MLKITITQIGQQLECKFEDTDNPMGMRDVDALNILFDAYFTQAKDALKHHKCIDHSHCNVLAVTTAIIKALEPVLAKFGVASANFGVGEGKHLIN